MMINIKIYCFLLILSCGFVQAQQKKFTVVIDAGHGGEDTGAVGNAVQGIYEKNITLAIAKKFGNMLEQGYDKQIKVVYTRTDDRFIPLKTRAQIANKNKADLFVSIHCNSNANKTPFGSETYVLGLHRSQDNFEVAKRENAVIFLEEDYQTTYEGFDPNSPESVIGMTLMQNQYLDNSIAFADHVQKNLKRQGRYNRGVKQAGFLVLRETATPSVLIEIGFISNSAEREFINSNEGKNKVTQAIYDAFKSFKTSYDKKNGLREFVPQEVVIKKEDPVKTDEVKVAGSSINDKKPIGSNSPSQATFKVQLASSGKSIEMNAANFKGLQGVKKMPYQGTYLYTYGESSDYQTIKKNQAEAQKKGFKDCFIIALKDGKKISVQEALKK